jgi:hypothetical protein
MNRAILAIVIGTLLGSGACTHAASGAELAGKRQAQGSDESVSLAHGSTLYVELDTSLDSKKAKAGDSVSARVTEPLKANGQTVIPKNAKILGHIAQASARSKGDPGSALAIVFDKIVIKKGQEVPLKAVIQAMAAAPKFTAEAGPDPATINDGSGAARGSPMGGAPHAAPGQVATAPGGVANSPGGTTGAPSSAGLDSAGRLTANSRGVIGLEGLHLSTDESSAKDGSLITTSGKSVRLDGGTRLLLVSE